MSNLKTTQSAWQLSFGKSIPRPVNKLAALVAGGSGKGRLSERDAKIGKELRSREIYRHSKQSQDPRLNEIKTSGRFYVCPLCQSVMLPKGKVVTRHFKSHGTPAPELWAAELSRKRAAEPDAKADKARKQVQMRGMR